MNRLQINQPLNQTPAIKLLKAGCAPPLLLATSVIPASAAISAEPEISEDAQRVLENMSTDRTAAESANLKSKLPSIKLLGTLSGGMSGEQYALPGECPKCRTMSSLKNGETICPPCRLIPHFNALIKEGKLSSEAWEQIRRALCLPKEIKNLTTEQMRAALQLLDLFVGRFSFDKQEAMTKEMIKKALIELPGLPGLLSKSLKKTVAADSPGSSGAKRKSISATRFTEVAARQGSYCFWCGIKVVRESEIPQANRISKNHSTIVYLSAGGEMREEAFGTIDHLIRVTDGGDNSAENLVISCYECNQERELKTLGYNRPFARRRVPCGTCGGRFFHPDWGCCSICGAIPERARKLSGWFGCLTKAIKRWLKIDR